MEKIKDRVVLGVVSGLVGNLVKTAIDEVSTKVGISKRSFRQTAAGAWVSKRKEVTSVEGQLLGSLLDYGMGAMGGVGTVYLLSKTGKDHQVTKGLVSGISVGSFLTFILSALPINEIRPKDASSNISYMVSHAAYGVVSSCVATALGDPALFNTKPKNDYLPSTEQTSVQEFKRPMMVKN